MTDELYVVIGAGAAGIAAARTLHDAGRRAVVIEARAQVGGRAWSIDVPGYDARLDLGCGWLHSAARNPWVDIARARGFTIDTSTARWGEQWRDLGFPPREQKASGAAWARFAAAARAVLPGPDRALADAVRDPRWRPHIDAISGYANGAPLARVSLHDWSAYEDHAGPDNWAVREGFGTLIADHAAGLDVRLGTPVTRIDHRDLRLAIETASGTIAADRAIVTVQTPALAQERIAFDPPLPDKVAAAGDLPLGLADKVFLHAPRGDWPDNAHLIGSPYRSATISYRLSPFGLPVIEGFYGGDFAERMDEAAATAFAIEELVALLGSDWRRRFTPLRASRWRAAAYIRGSYSQARIGASAQRQALAAPVDDRLFFAGEACSRNDFSTAHGAYATGVAAARALLAAAGSA